VYFDQYFKTPNEQRFRSKIKVSLSVLIVAYHDRKYQDVSSQRSLTHFKRFQTIKLQRSLVLHPPTDKRWSYSGTKTIIGL
jgi:hypothetical protein